VLLREDHVSAPRTRSLDVPAQTGWSPVATALAVWVAFVAISVAGTLALGALAPGFEGKSRDLVVELALAVFALALIAARGWRREVGFTAPGTWRHPALLVVPALILLLPFAGGLRSIDTSTLALLIVGYTLNSIAEDGVFRGVEPQVLRAKGLVWVVVLSSLLFGLAHFANILSRPDQSVAITAAQSFGAFTEGIGLMAIRLAMRSVVPVMVLHAVSDLFFQLGGLPIVPANVVHSTLMLLFGLWVLRRYRAELAADGWR
jgi:hypothetical protein